MTVGNLQDASRTLTAAVAETLDALGLGAEDAAVKRLAIRYAEVIDGCDDNPAWAARWIAPHLLECLDALGATPDARARIRKLAKGGDSPASAPATRLDQLRASRASRRTP